MKFSSDALIPPTRRNHYSIKCLLVVADFKKITVFLIIGAVFRKTGMLFTNFPANDKVKGKKKEAEVSPVKQYKVTFQPGNRVVCVPGGTTVQQAQSLAGIRTDAPCGGRGTCGKCRVTLEGGEVLACQTVVDRDMEVFIPETNSYVILDSGRTVQTRPEGLHDYVLAVDVGTTTLVASLLDGRTGAELARSGCPNPQGRYGADVISRLQYERNEKDGALTRCIRQALTELAAEAAAKAGISVEKIGCTAIAGNTAMHHLLLGLDTEPLVTPPYMPAVSESMERNGARILPNIAGFVGGDTVACLVATRFDRAEELTLLLDIGTNGELVLGDKYRRMACSTAAGPAFEGANISCGMGGAAGAVDHVTRTADGITYHVIGDGKPQGLCGSGLLDLVAALLEEGIIEKSGRMKGKSYSLCDGVTLTQKDVREVQLAKAAIRVGIDLLAQQLGVRVADIRRVYLAGAFGNYMNPDSACRIGMIPAVLRDRIVPIGNGAGEGAKLCALNREEFEYAGTLARETEFLELAKLPQFQNRFIEELNF